MTKKYKPIKSQPEYTENPFVERAVEDISVIKKTQIIRPTSGKDEIQLIVKDGEVTGHTAFMRYIEVDEEKFAKVYLSQFTAFWELSKPAIRVFSYILTVLKPNSDVIYFDMEDCLAHTKYSTEKSVFEGLINLIESGILARSNKHYKYFINPLVVFNGNRITFAKTYVKKKKKAIDDPNQMKIFQDDEMIGIKEFQEEFNKK